MIEGSTTLAVLITINKKYYDDKLEVIKFWKQAQPQTQKKEYRINIKFIEIYFKSDLILGKGNKQDNQHSNLSD